MSRDAESVTTRTYTVSGIPLDAQDMAKPQYWVDQDSQQTAGLGMSDAAAFDAGADLSGAGGLIQAQLEETTGDESTQLPSDLKPPAHWSEKTDEQSEEH